MMEDLVVMDASNGRRNARSTGDLWMVHEIKDDHFVSSYHHQHRVNV